MRGVRGDLRSDIEDLPERGLRVSARRRGGTSDCYPGFASSTSLRQLSRFTDFPGSATGDCEGIKKRPDVHGQSPGVRPVVARVRVWAKSVAWFEHHWWTSWWVKNQLPVLGTAYAERLPLVSLHFDRDQLRSRQVIE